MADTIERKSYAVREKGRTSEAEPTVRTFSVFEDRKVSSRATATAMQYTRSQSPFVLPWPDRRILAA
jgi:hypothetical protein